MENTKMTLQEFSKRIENVFPEWKYDVIMFNGYKSEAEIKCIRCGQIIKLKKASDLFRKINACKCSKYFKNNHDKLKYLSEHYNFNILFDGPATKKKEIQCKKCNLIMKRSLNSILCTPWHCDNCNNYAKGKSPYSKDYIQKQLNIKFNNQYELLKYNGMTKDAMLKHLNCGFIFKIRELGDLFEGRNRGCPKCYQFKSQGEQSIMNYLDKNNINFIPQKTFAPLNKSKYRFDFYLPDFNIAIEYQGEQHYRDNEFFKDSLSTIQRRDKIKKQYCIDNNIELIEIKYTDLKNIPIILDSRLNDYLERE